MRHASSDAVARLDMVRTLRDLGLDLPTIRMVVDRELSLPVAGSGTWSCSQ
ncbi:hypothetical protein ABT126_00885 [Streptomyces sp. NPDC002012]|uniref:hypothetical protein n=1 Tax=Streptomyces sp. NPDC002012 TaxID=3154532 RepID=UPI002E13D2DB|nr:hypothetical protein OG609_28640 [Streptomyces sp. NBC_01224]